MSRDYDPDNLPPDGNLSGTHIPDYLKKVPWYFNTGVEGSLEHLKMTPFAQQKYNEIDEIVKHGRVREKEMVKWRPGCCRNCGAPTHSEQDCPERPRKRNARVAGGGIVEKEVVEKHDLSYDAKHDYFSNYDKARWWHEVQGRYRYADKVRAQKGQGKEEKIQIQEEFGHSTFRNRLDTADYINAIGKTKSKIDDDSDLFVKPVEKDEESKGALLMAWEGDEQTRLKLRGIKQKKQKKYSINNPKMINANAQS